MAKLVLASSSPYRRELLSRLGLPFECFSPEIDESPIANEPAATLVARLAQAKAEALAQQCPGSLIIGSDQVADFRGQILTKPGNFATAVAQLSACSGQRVTFLSGLSLYDTSNSRVRTAVVETQVQFRTLSEPRIVNYLRREQPFDCAGSFKCEGLGITLFESIRSADPTALIGLPLISLTQLLIDAGLDPLAAEA